MFLKIVNCFLFPIFLHVTIPIIVMMAQGKIRGIEHDGYHSYVGVPYASVNENGRFKKAGTAPTWAGVRESQDPYCTVRSEVQDCLQLDVHVPKSGKSWPVLVWVKGSSGDYRPGKLVQESIIVVIVRHRLGSVGFMCSKEDKIPGNAGAKDIVLALRWIRDNIVAFKGNPHRVVIAGQGFGAAIVEAILLSSMARGLYHGAILQSGTILAPWSFNYDAQNKTDYLQMMLNGTNTSVLFKYTIPEIIAKSEEIDVSYFPFGICAEKPFKNEERFLWEAPFDTLMKGKMASVPIIIGYNTNEAYVFVSILKDINVTKKMARDASFLLPMELQSISNRERQPLNKEIEDFYFRHNVTMSSVLEYHRDAYFLSHIHRSAKFHAIYGPVFYYQFSHLSNVGVEPEAGVEKTGAAHSDELAYLFPTNEVDFVGNDVIVHQHLIQLWSNFVKNLYPTTKENEFQWTPTEAQKPQILDIQAQPEIIDFPYSKQTAMWEEMYEKYYFRRH